MISMRILNPTSAAGHIAYLSETVTQEQHPASSRALSPLTRYFHDAGNPPGRWVGAGTAALGLTDGWSVSATAMEHLFQDGTHPLTGAPMTAHEYVKHVPLEQRITREVAALSAELTASERADAVVAIRAEQTEKRQRPSVSGFEMVFSPPKSFSVAWGLGDVAMKERLSAAHDAALAETLKVMEDDYLRTRTGVAGVAQMTTQGAVAARFDHWNSRALDPHLHTHVLIANRVQGVDGKWRTIDSRGTLAPAVVTFSETYTTLLMDAVTRDLGWEWNNTTPNAAAKNAKWELAGVPTELITAFSQRSVALLEEKDVLVDRFRQERGREPSDIEVLRLREQARRNTAPKKQVRSLRDLTTGWQQRATQIMNADPATWLARIEQTAIAALPARVKTLWRGDDLPTSRVDELVDQTLATLNMGRSTWRRHNAAAEIQRLLKGDRFATAADRQRFVTFAVDQVVAAAVPLTPPARFSAPIQFQTPDGASAFVPRGRDVFTTQDVLDAETRLLSASHENTFTPSVSHGAVEAALADHASLDEGQAAAVAAIATAHRHVDVLVGPAGTGKTTTLRAMRAAWESEHGEGSVVGLAPSSVAAEVLGQSLGIHTENTAKWLFEHDRNPAEWSFRAGQLVIVDEAGLSGTLALDRLRAQTESAGAKLLLVGDPHQLTAIDAGGAFGMLVRHLGNDAATLTSVWRFENQWEATASLQLRHGSMSALNAYDEHERLHYGDRNTILDNVFDAWRHDESAGRESLLIADDNDTVAELNARAQAWRADAGLVDTTTSILARAGQSVAVGDRVVTRANDRRLKTALGNFAKNGQRWTVAATFEDGSAVLRSDMDSGNNSDTLTVGPDYVQSSLDLAYAITTHRAQGSTVDTAHAVLTERGTRESTYVAMTRGRTTNHAWVITAEDDTTADDPTFRAPRTGREILEGILDTSGAQLSAHETRDRATFEAASIRQLANEYDTLSSAASSTRWSAVLQEAITPGSDNPFVVSTAWDSLSAALREANARGLPIEQALPELIEQRPFQPGDDPAAVLHYRVQQWCEPRVGKRPAMIAGLIVRADTTSAEPALIAALEEREAAILERATALIDAAAHDPASWLGGITAEQRTLHHDQLIVVVAYRDRHGIAETDPRPLGGPPKSDATARGDWRAARTAWKAVSPDQAPVTHETGTATAQDDFQPRVVGPTLS